MIPTIGRIVHYTLSEQNASAINKRRHDAAQSGIASQESGAQVHFGNGAQAGQVYPAIIVRTWGDTEDSVVQLQVFLDGNDTFWATSAVQGDAQGQWRQPPRA